MIESNYPKINFIKNANLPVNMVNLVFVDERISNECEKTLKTLGIELLKIKKSTFYEEPISAHPDIQMCHLKDNLWIFNNKISIPNFLSVIKDTSIVGEYPKNISLNCVILPKFVICNEKHTSNEILEFCKNKKIINVKQGYCKCSVAIVDENSIITEDWGIHRACVKNNINSLLLKNKEVKLNGYNCGFIGGATVKLNKNILAFTGNIELHSEYLKILEYCKNLNIDLFSLSKEPLYDYGSILPIFEK